jgi:hypothetical protein
VGIHAFGVLGRSREDNSEMELTKNDCEDGERRFKAPYTLAVQPNGFTV